MKITTKLSETVEVYSFCQEHSHLWLRCFIVHLYANYKLKRIQHNYVYLVSLSSPSTTNEFLIRHFLTTKLNASTLNDTAVVAMCSSYKVCHTTIHSWLIWDQEESKCFYEIFAVNNTVNKHTVACSWCYLAVVLGHLSRFPTRLVTLIAPYSSTTLAIMWCVCCSIIMLFHYSTLHIFSVVTFFRFQYCCWWQAGCDLFDLASQA